MTQNLHYTASGVKQTRPPSLPPEGIDCRSDEEVITTELLNLARTNPSHYSVDVALIELRKRFKTGKLILKKMYETAEQKAKCEQMPPPVEPSAQELTARKQEEERQQTEKKLKEQEEQEAREAGASIGKSENIFEEFAKAVQMTGYQADLATISSLLMSHGALFLPNSSGFMVFGASGSGKSDLVITCAKFLPEAWKRTITSASPQAFYYLGDLKGQYLVFGEMHPVKEGEDDYRQTAMRQLISENEITRDTVEKSDGNSNQLVTKRTKGPCVMIATTTSPPTRWHDELVNRLSHIATEDDTEQTMAVLQAKARASMEPWKNNRREQEKMFAAWHAFYQSLEALPVVIPFADKITPLPKHVTARRLYGLLENYVKASALLHQKSRKRFTAPDGQTYLEATIADYRIAHKLIERNAPKVLELVSGPALKAFEKLKPQLDRWSETAQVGRTMTTGQIQEHLNENPETVRKWIRELRDAGYLHSDRSGGRENIYMLGVEAGKRQNLGLVDPEKIQNAS